MPKVQRGNVKDIWLKQYVYGVQISNIGKGKIGSAKYNFPTKTEAVKWAVKNTGKRQYGTIVRVLNKYYVDASNYTQEYSYHTLAYEKGVNYGYVRQSPIGPIFIDEMEEYFYRINEDGRLYGKTKIAQIPLTSTSSFYNKNLHKTIFSYL